METQIDAYTIEKFCQRHGISRSLLYKAWKAGSGPEKMIVGERILISREAAERWRRAGEEAAKNAPAPRRRGRAANSEAA